MDSQRFAKTVLQLLEADYPKEALCLLLEASKTTPNSLPHKGPRYNFFITGDDQGRWDLSPHYDWGALKYGKWMATASLSSKNDWKNLSVDNATEHHKGFQKALHEVLTEYPELREWWIAFDGPYRPITEVFKNLVPQATTDWSKITFFHGTSLWAWEQIQRKGLLPRSATNVDPVYGIDVGAPAGREDAIYLTTQSYMAQAAAHQAAIKAAKSGQDPRRIGVILYVEGRDLDPTYIKADEDSRSMDPEKSLATLGSIAYTQTIPAHVIKVADTIDYKRE